MSRLVFNHELTLGGGLLRLKGMEMRKDSPVVGKRAWFDPIRPGVELPGWSHNARVAVVSMRRDVLCYVTIRNAKGEEREVPHFDLDCGYSFKGRSGEWIHESDPRVMKWLERKSQNAVNAPGRVYPRKGHRRAAALAMDRESQ